MEVFMYKYDDLFNPTLKAVKELGGSGSVDEIEEKVIDLMNLSEEEINDIHRGNITKLSYRLAWSRNYLKRYGLLINSKRGVWSITDKGQSINEVDKENVKRVVKSIDAEDSNQIESNQIESNEIERKSDVIESKSDEIIEIEWQDKVLGIIKGITPDAFERLAQRLLREMGFADVEVTGRAGDKGIDGVGFYRIEGIITYKIVFQCKRYHDTVTPDKVRDFRGAVDGRGARGLLITTGRFTKEARKEAHREGAIPIDLIDGNDLIEKLKENKLGIETKEIFTEEITINEDWFNKI